MSVSENRRHVSNGISIGMGIAIIAGGFLFWWFVNSVVGIFISWAQEHGYTFLPSGYVALNQIPLLMAVIIALGFGFLIWGIFGEMRMRPVNPAPPP